MKRNGEPGLRCERCAEIYAARQSQYQARVRAERIEKGLCPSCGAERDRPEVQLCKACRDLISTNSKRYHARKTRKKRMLKARRKLRQRKTADRATLARHQADTILRQLSLAPHNRD